MKKRTLKSRHKKSAIDLKTDLAAKELLDSTESLKLAGDLLLKAVQSLQENNENLSAAADALIAAHSSLINAVQRLAYLTEKSKTTNRLIPEAANRLKTLEYTLN